MPCQNAFEADKGMYCGSSGVKCGSSGVWCDKSGFSPFRGNSSRAARNSSGCDGMLEQLMSARPAVASSSRKMTASGGEWEGTGLVCVSGEDEEAPVSSSSLVLVKFTSAVTVVADKVTVTVFANRVLVQVPSRPGRQLSHILLALAQAQRPQVPVLLQRQQTIADQVPPCDILV